MTKDNKYISEFGMALRNFKRNRFAVFCVVVLCLLYAGAIFANFLSPYSYKNEDRNYSYCPPIPVKIIDNGKLTWPFINGIKLTFDEYNKRVYVVNTDKKYPIRLFVKGDEYKLFGLIPARHHLFGIGEEGRIYLLLALRAAVPDNFSSLQVYFSIILILSFIGWASLARIIRGMCLSLREREYVLAAKSLGLTNLQIIIRHILPHTLSYSIFAIMLSIPGYILGESALSLIGLGIQDPFASWGNMLSDAMSIIRIRFAPWILYPAFFIFLTVICFNVIGNALRDCLDPMLNEEG